MPAPVLKSWAARLYDRMGPLLGQEAALGYPLANYCGAIGEMFQKLDDYSRAQGVNGKYAPGWSQLLDPLRCPKDALPWLGQFVGVQVNTALSEADQRNQIIQRNGWSRGTVGAMVAALAATLTGTKSITVIERDSSVVPSLPAYGISLYSRTSETPNSAASLAAVQAAKPAGLVLNYVVLPNATYGDLFSAYATYGIIYSTFRTYQGVYENKPGT